MGETDFQRAERILDLNSRVNSPLPSETLRVLLKSALLLSDGRAKARRFDQIERLTSAWTAQLPVSEKPQTIIPSADKLSGQIKIGTLLQNPTQQVFISLEDIQRGVAVIGSTGAGKTVETTSILMQLQPEIDLECTDWKRDMRGLCRKHRVKILRWEWLKLSVWQPPKGVPQDVWNFAVADLFTHNFHFFSASENYLVSFVSRLSRNHTDGTYPTVREVYDEISATEEHSRRFDEYRAVVRNRLENMLIVWGDRINYPRAPPLEDILFKGRTVLEVDGLPRDQAAFLSSYTLAYEFLRRLYNGVRGSVNLVIVNDEATKLFFKRDYSMTNQELGPSFLESIPQFIRDYRIGLIFCFQEPSIASHSMLANTNLKIVGSITEGEDLDAICKSLDLDEIEREAITLLEPGEFLVKKPGVRAFTIRGENFVLEKDMSDAELKARMKEMFPEAAESWKTEPKENEERKVVLPTISDVAWDVLISLTSHPFLGIEKRARLLRVSAEKIELAKSELLQRGLVHEVSIPLGRGRPVLLLAPSEEALKMVADVGHNVGLLKHVGNIGWEHAFLVVLVKYALTNSGYNVQTEKIIGNRRVDIFAEQDGHRIGVEVEITTEDVESKLNGLENVDELIILARDIKKVNEMRARFEETHPELRSKVSFRELGKFLREINKKIEPEGSEATSDQPNQPVPPSFPNKFRRKSEGE